MYVCVCVCAQDHAGFAIKYLRQTKDRTPSSAKPSSSKPSGGAAKAAASVWQQELQPERLQQQLQQQLRAAAEEGPSAQWGSPIAAEQKQQQDKFGCV